MTLDFDVGWLGWIYGKASQERELDRRHDIYISIQRENGCFCRASFYNDDILLSEIVIDGFALLSLLTKRVLRMEHISSRFNGNLTKEWRTHLHAQNSGHSVEILSVGKFMIFQQNQRNNSSNQLFSNFFSKNVGFTKFLPRDCESISEICNHTALCIYACRKTFV